jgi:hypothetical protein
MKTGVGWLHLVGNDPPSKWRSVQRTKPKRPSAELLTVAKECCGDLTRGKLDELASRLGVSFESLLSLRVGWSVAKHAYSFPMRDEYGRVCGIRYRCEPSGHKFSESGGREGMFYLPDELADYLVIVEGASDAASAITMGFPSVIGRSNNLGNVQQLLQIIRHHQFNTMVIVPDNDEPGLRGAEALVATINEAGLPRPEILHLPTGMKDCRVCIQQEKSARWLQSTLARLTNHNPKTNFVMHEATDE